MVDEDDGPPLEARPAGVDDLVALCRSLNREGARYVVIGGMAIIQAGFVRATQDIEYADASREVDRVNLEGVEIPFANAKLLWKTKQTVRDKDRQDRAFLARLLGPEAQG